MSERMSAAEAAEPDPASSGTVFVPEETPKEEGVGSAKLIDRAWFWSLIVLALGVVGGVVWALATPLAQYEITPEQTATTTERGLALGPSPLVVFSVIVLVLGIVAGVLLWRPLRGRGAVAVLWNLLTVATAEGVVWGVGRLLGPGDLDARILAGQPGEVIPADLALGTPVPFVVGLMSVALVTMSLAAFSPDPEDSGEAPVDERWAKKA